ncbi:myosin 3 [Chamberlinius hualienensis]
MGPSKVDYDGLSVHVNFNKLPDPGSRFQLLGVIGEGTYGEVCAAKDTQTGTLVAIKILENISDNVEEIEEEYLVLRDLCAHPNIPTFYGMYLKRSQSGEDDQLWFVMEMCAGGSVTDLVSRLEKLGKRLTEEQIAYILKETLQAMIYLHENHCIHRDVKGHNILLTDEAEIKLVDFGVSSHLISTTARCNTSVGTPYWMAPEVIACERQYEYSYDVRCDIWSLGITAIELAEGSPPLAEIHPMRALFQIPRNPSPTFKNPSQWSDNFNLFVKSCLAKDFEKRPYARTLLDHPFFQKSSNNYVNARRQLKEILKCISESPRSERKIDATTKHGKLKSNRKSKRQPIFVDDLASLENLTKDIVVDQLFQRYVNKHIYTYIGDILLAVNPFQDPGIYSEEHSLKYRNKARSSNPPHIFAVADSAYHLMLHQLRNQCIVISGESGAGKTESANLLLKQFVALGRAPNRNLEDKILQVNPVMEAFGNARTGINDNSSRFGKFLELSFTKTGKIIGAKVHIYLLEHSRVVFQEQGEGNFHILTCLYDGLERRNALKPYHLDGNSHYEHRYLNSLSCLQSIGSQSTKERNCQRFETVNSGFKLLGFTDVEVDTIFRILAAILILGDLDYIEGISDDNTDISVVADLQILHKVADLLGVKTSRLRDALTKNSVVTRGETIQRHNGVCEAVNTRDATAKALYGRLFDWIVNRINKLLSVETVNRDDTLGIGILDIFGFENFPKNSFEQMCINIANEHLQFYFNQHVFAWEQKEYMQEGLDIDLIEFCDNRPVLEMFLSKPVGLLALLDEESHFPKSSDASLVEKFHCNIKSPYYHKPRLIGLLFTIQHYAGPVTYNAQKFLEKNRNFLPLEIIQVFRQSKYDIIRSQFQCPLTKTGHLYSDFNRDTTLSSPDILTLDIGLFNSKCKSKELASQTRAQQTSATYFRYSLMDLLQKIVHGTPHFVRCLKPNGYKTPGLFDRSSVSVQLAYAGVLEAVRIRQNGYSHRMTFADFLKRYCFLGFRSTERVAITRENCRLLLTRLRLEGWAIGRTKVFLKYYHMEFFTREYQQYVNKVVKVQACVRRYLAKKRVSELRRKQVISALTLQRYARGWLARKRLSKLRNEKKTYVNDPARRLPPGARPQLLILKTGLDSIEIGQKPPPKSNSGGGEQKAAVMIQKMFRRWKGKKSSDVQNANQNNKARKSHQVPKRSSNIPVPVSRARHDVVRSNGHQVPQKAAAPKKKHAPKPPTNGNPQLIKHTPIRLSEKDKNQREVIVTSANQNQQMKKLPIYRPNIEIIPAKVVENKHTTKVPVNGYKLDGLTSAANRKIPLHPPEIIKTADQAIELSPVLKHPLKRSPVFSDQTIEISKKNNNENLKCFLRKIDISPSEVNRRNQEEDAGPYDFKKLLRKTSYAPTESLRRRKGIVSVIELPTLRPVSTPIAQPRTRHPSPPQTTNF